MPQTVLLTSADEDSRKFRQFVNSINHCNLLHLPLEIYRQTSDTTSIKKTLDNLDRFENIIYSSLRNATYFLSFIHTYQKADDVRNLVNLTIDTGTVRLLEEEGIPAIYPGADKPIKLVELMIRLRRMGPVLFPTGKKQKEEIPGLLMELDIPVKELEVLQLTGPRKNDLVTYRNKVKNLPPNIVIFHSKRAVNRTLLAFPFISYESVTVISANAGVSRKLNDAGIKIAAEADGSWSGIEKALQQMAE